LELLRDIQEILEDIGDIGGYRRYWRIKEILNDVGDIGGYLRYRRI